MLLCEEPEDLMLLKQRQLESTEAETHQGAFSTEQISGEFQEQSNRQTDKDILSGRKKMKDTKYEKGKIKLISKTLVTSI